MSIASLEITVVPILKITMLKASPNNIVTMASERNENSRVYSGNITLRYTVVKIELLTYWLYLCNVIDDIYSDFVFTRDASFLCLLSCENGLIVALFVYLVVISEVSLFVVAILRP